MHPPSQSSDIDNDYHLRVVSYWGDPESRRFEGKVDDFLENLYNLDLGVPGCSKIQPPLKFSECRLSQHDGRFVVLVKSSIHVAEQIFSTLSLFFKYHRLDFSCPRVVHSASLSTVHLQISAKRFSSLRHHLLHEP
jgi:hypothetical protein